MDPKMGTIDRNFKCETCGEAMAECPGHFGHIELARPVFHVGFLIKVKKIVECICVQCGRLKVDGEDPAIRQIVRRIPPKDRLKYIWDKAKAVSVCMQDDVKSEDDPNAGPVEPQGIQHHGCGHIQPVIRKEGLKLFVVYKKSKEEDDEVLGPPLIVKRPSWRADIPLSLVLASRRTSRWLSPTSGRSRPRRRTRSCAR